jgi:hypothetical protein
MRNGNGSRDPDRILAQIEETRSEMDSTLRAIESRLTPGELIDQGLDYLRHSGGREFIENLGTSLKANPVPATLVGIGLAWLMLTQHTGRTGAAQRRADTDDDSSTTETFAAAVSTARDPVSATADRARDAWNATTSSAREQIDRARDQYRHVLQEQPLALGFVGVGLGALLAAAMPRTRQEDELLGGASDSVKERIGEATREQIEKVREASGAAADASVRSDGESGPVSREGAR